MTILREIIIIFQMIKLGFREVEWFAQLTQGKTQLLGEIHANQISECFPLNPVANITLITVLYTKGLNYGPETWQEAAI